MLTLALTVQFGLAAPTSLAADNRAWELKPYRIHVTVAVDDRVRPQPGLEAAIAKTIVERVEGTISPLWKMDLKVADSVAARRACFDLKEIGWDEIPADLKAYDKLMWLGVRATSEGYLLRCREFDVYTRRWGPIREQLVRQTSFVGDASFALLRETFSPLAVVQPLAENDAEVQLIFKGRGLPRRGDQEPFVSAGDVFQPVLRRTDRSGKLIGDGVLPVPWTFLSATESGDGGWLAAIQSGTRRPFGAKPRGNVQQLAIGLRNPPGPARVRFYARADKTQGLAGYEVFRANETGDTEPIGVTDREGIVSVPPGDNSLTMLLLRSDGQLLAKVPVPTGDGPLIETPIADNAARLQAQAESQVVREELIDLVARRAIMMGRVRSLLKQQRVDDAKELMSQLDSLPSPSVFNRSIDAAAKRIAPSNDPTVQKRIDLLFSTTRELLAKFLSVRPILDLQGEVNAATSAKEVSEVSTSTEGT